MSRRRRPKRSVAALHRHFRKRLGERHGLYDVDPATVDAAIRAGRSAFVFKESNSRSHHDVEIAGRRCRVVYDTNLNAVCTVLPPQPGATP